MAVLITAKNVGLEFPTKRVFEGVTLGVNAGERIGIVGKNGDGKSTLLGLLSGAIEPDAGEVLRSGSPTVGVLAQSDALSDSETVEHAVVGDVPAYTWAADRATREIIAALLADVPWDGLVGELSGGQRRRVDLARLLIGSWDVLMLDEPTNHLDIRTISWLATHLARRWPKGTGALLVVTHDRWFLDEVCTSMWEVHDGVVEPFEGGYSAYILQRVERDRQAQVAERKRRNLARKELAWLSRGARARSTKPKFHLEVARALIADEPPVRNPLELRQMAMARLGKQVLELENATVRFGEKAVLDRATWLIGPGDRYGLLGENGAGKTTLLRVLDGALALTSGRVKVGKTVKMAVLSQRLEELEPLANDRVREVLSRHKTRYILDGKPVTSSQLLERMGFERAHLQARVADLSGGQKRRLQLLLTLLEEPNVLILDEPGNDMDTDMLAVMEDLLDSWPGTLVLVTHDRYLMERVTDDQFALVDGKVVHLPGGVDEYLRMAESRAESAGAPAIPSTASAHGSDAAKGSAENLAESNASNAPTQPALTGGAAYQARKQLASLERKMATLETKREAARAAMHEVDPSDYVALGQKQAELDAIQAQIGELEEQWLELSEQLEG